MSIVCDTDVLSAFAKIDGLDLFSRLFPKHKVAITNGVYEELMSIKQAGYEFPDGIFSIAEMVIMTEAELEKYHSFLLFTRLGKGELQCISVCIHRKLPFITNDKKAKRFAQENNVIAWDIPDILKALWKTGVLTKDEVRDIMKALEEKDMMVISRKETILR